MISATNATNFTGTTNSANSFASSSGSAINSSSRIDTFNYHSLRAREARLSKLFCKKWVKALLVFLEIACILGGAALVILHSQWCWICFSVAIFLLMMLFWIKAELTSVPVGKGNSLNDVLSREALAIMPKNPTPKSILPMVKNTTSGKFLNLRYGISEPLLDLIIKDLPPEIDQIFSIAKKIQAGTDSEEITGAVLIVAAIASHPGSENILKRLKLELVDLLDGIVWFNHLNGLVKSISIRRHSGGIARDLSFGYIPVLQKFGQNISKEREQGVRIQIQQTAHQQILGQMAQIFSGDGRQNVALIGPDGSGRSTIVTAFAEMLLDADSGLPHNLKFRQIFKLDAAALISFAGERGQLEGLVTHLLGETFSAKNIILWLENAQLFFEDGVGSVDLTNVLQPYLEAGRLRIIMTMDRQKFLEISAKKSTLANLLNKIMVSPANEQDTIKVMQDQAPILEYQHKVTYTIWALKEAYKLSERYIHDLEMPGRAVALLDTAGNYAENSLVLAESVQKAVEKTEGVKVQLADDREDKDKLLNMESLIHQRMVDQEAAVKTVSDALRRAAAGVRNENRPIGTFLFLGPTGVGKTELAKALSEVYFNGENKIIRLDLNEFVESGDVARLIADATEDELSLTAQVMKQPFSVVLLDEIEKAHPQVLTTLLQMLDEGILRDAKNKEVSFRDTIVIATSNAGANKIRDYVAAGENLVSMKDELINWMIAENIFKPEFLNRFDEVCLFKPLSITDSLQIVDLIIAGVNKTLESQKIVVELDPPARELLVRRGYDPQLGARPMKRIIQKTVENIVAKFVLSGQVGSGTKIKITSEMIENELK